MATAEPVTVDTQPLKRSSSFPHLPPDLSELRVVLLGNSWSERSSMGNFILGETVFNTEEEPDDCLRFSGQLKDKHIVLINTPDLLHPNIVEHRLTKYVKNCVRLSDPGPHVFLLVLQPEDFTEEQKLRLCRVLKLLSDRSFDHSLVLVSAPREETSHFMERDAPVQPLKNMIKTCGYRHLKRKNLEYPELLTRLGQIVKENNGHVSCDVFEDAATGDQESLKKVVSSKLTKAVEANVPSEYTPSHQCDLRIVMFGKSEDRKKSLCKMIFGSKVFNFFKFNPTKQCEVARGSWRGKQVTVVKTPDIFSLSVEAVREEMSSCVTLSLPGPNVLLLLVKPSDFTEKNRKTLKFILSLFDHDAFKYSMVVITHKWNQSSDPLSKLVKDCEHKHYSMVEENQLTLMTKIENMVHKNEGTFLTITDKTMRPKFEPMKPALNLVLCGRRGAVKTSAVKSRSVVRLKNETFD